MTSTAVGTHAFRAIVWKELREGVRWCVLCMLIATVGLVAALVLAMLIGSAGNGMSIMSISPMTTFLGPVIGLMLGFAQIMPERAGDERSFLVHRPVNRSTLFLAKAAAGKLLYLIACGIPLTCVVWWSAIPGHVPSPFDIRMIEPSVADVAVGYVYYCAALLTGMRDARWLATRVFGIGAALTCSWAVIAASSLLGALGYAALGVLVIGTAARTTFVSGGRYAPQPVVGRLAVALSIGSGLSLVLGFGFFLMGAGWNFAVHHPLRDVRASSYTLTRDGSVVQTARTIGQNATIVEVKDLQGRRLDQSGNPDYREPKMTEGVVSVSLMINPQAHVNSVYDLLFGHYRTADDIYASLSPATNQDSTDWYFVYRSGLIVGYNKGSARLVGWIGPSGFVAGAKPPAEHFQGPLRALTDWTDEILAGAAGAGAVLQAERMLITIPTAVYRLDLQHRQITKLYEPPSGDSVLAAGAPILSGEAVGSGGRFIAIATQRTVRVLSDGSVLLDVPRDSLAAGYGTLRVARAYSTPGAPTFLWYRPGDGILASGTAGSAPEEVTEFGKDSHVLAHYSLPPIRDSVTSGADPVARGLDLVSTPLAERVRGAIQRWWNREPGTRQTPISRRSVIEWIMSVLLALGFGGTAYWRGRRYGFTVERLWVWAVIGFALGILGVALMFAVLEWPGRVKCPVCGKPRVVTRDSCEHCAAAFPAPPADGTEIFEPIVAGP